MFKFLVFLAFIAAASALPPYTGHSTSYVSPDDVHAETKSYQSEIDANGFHYSYETTNNIRASAAGNAYGDIQGNFEWISPEGEHIAVKYVANADGYQPSSDVLPTPHPIPVAILKALDYIRTHPPYEEHFTKKH